MKLKRIVEQQELASQYYDLGRDFWSFTQAIDSTTETVKNQFEKAIASKLKNKKIRARASRGYKQFEKDYEINVVSVSLDDYYDNYVVVVKGSNDKEYFLKPGFKVQIIGTAEAEAPTKKQSKKSTPEPSSEPTPAASQLPQAVPQEMPAELEQPPVTEINKSIHNNSVSIEDIEMDLKKWLPRLLMNNDKNLRSFIPRDGISTTKDNKTIVSYGVTIPIEDLPGLTVDQINKELSQISDKAIYALDKFDVRGDKYVMIIRKTTNI